MALYNSRKDMFNNLDDSKRLRGVVKISINDLLNRDSDIINRIEELFVGDAIGLLAETNYRIVGCDTISQEVFIQVTADVYDELWEYA